MKDLAKRDSRRISKEWKHLEEDQEEVHEDQPEICSKSFSLLLLLDFMMTK